MFLMRGKAVFAVKSKDGDTWNTYIKNNMLGEIGCQKKNAKKYFLNTRKTSCKIEETVI